jgi:hypothetical protein
MTPVGGPFFAKRALQYTSASFVSDRIFLSLKRLAGWDRIFLFSVPAFTSEYRRGWAIFRFALYLQFYLLDALLENSASSSRKGNLEEFFMPHHFVSRIFHTESFESLDRLCQRGIPWDDYFA